MNRFDAPSLEVIQLARAEGIVLTVAESCTGGLVAGALTEHPGSSDAFDRGFVTYSNAAKQDMLGVREDTLERYGAVSAETAAEMALGALERSAASIAVSITGIAGPGGGTAEKPVGLVWFGLAQRGRDIRLVEKRFADIGRRKVRSHSVVTALALFRRALVQGEAGNRKTDDP